MSHSLELTARVVVELECEPRVDPALIRVTVDNGLVTLSGVVSSYAQKVVAERAVKRVPEVKAVASNLEVRLPFTACPKDSELAQAVASGLEWDVMLPDASVQVRVADGWVTLEGQLATERQRAAAQGAVARVTGVRGVSDLIRVEPINSPTDLPGRVSR
ncbi:MAG TPA: BON domain-containing protein [Gemmatimonadales bacterium]|jgi:osmotically-inducible protein OsmY|nr:BON domain-containing protein [Gemmatimonadales bacterium]